MTAGQLCWRMDHALRLPLELHLYSHLRGHRWVWSLMRRMPDQRYSYWNEGWSNDSDDFAWVRCDSTAKVWRVPLIPDPNFILTPNGWISRP